MWALRSSLCPALAGGVRVPVYAKARQWQRKAHTRKPDQGHASGAVPVLVLPCSTKQHGETTAGPHPACHARRRHRRGDGQQGGLHPAPGIRSSCASCACRPCHCNARHCRRHEPRWQLDAAPPVAASMAAWLGSAAPGVPPIIAARCAARARGRPARRPPNFRHAAPGVTALGPRAANPLGHASPHVCCPADIQAAVHRASARRHAHASGRAANLSTCRAAAASRRPCRGKGRRLVIGAGLPLGPRAAASHGGCRCCRCCRGCCQAWVGVQASQAWRLDAHRLHARICVHRHLPGGLQPGARHAGQGSRGHACTDAGRGQEGALAQTGAVH